MDELDPSLKIRTKAVHILITNACNLSCGGCNQLIGHFPKEKIFHVPVAEVRAHIEKAIAIAKEDWHQPWFPPRHRNLSIYGGEPTVHPNWPEILQMLYKDFSEWPFVILSNGKTFIGKERPESGDERFEYIKKRKDIKAHDRNVFWRIDPKNTSRYFIPTLVAPIDVIGNPDPALYYEMAKKNCPHYESCETLIYRDKGYFCVNAGPMDWLFHDGVNGWDIHNVEHPFKRTNEEIEEQGKLFCHRCCFSLGAKPVIEGVINRLIQQPITSKGFVSETNFDQVAEGTGQLVTFDKRLETPP